MTIYPDGYNSKIFDDVPCKGLSHLFYPSDERAPSTRQAKEICKTCHARIECLQYALDNEEEYGIWGGTTTRDRLRILGKIPALQRNKDGQAQEGC